MSTQAVYSQAPLVTERRDIRILVLAPGSGNDVLCGELVVESLDYDDLHYTALSYTWSGSVGEHFISIGSAPLYITENLSMALRRIRGPTRPRNMWIDAICINQDDLEEKAIQVNMMGDIFASATRTIVWLGEKSADSDVAMDFIGSLQQSTSDQLCDDKNVEQKFWRAIKDLMQRKWWTRVWVVQEALMSRRVLFQCGEKTADVVKFVKLVKEKESRVKHQPEQSELPSENPFKNILSNWYAHKGQAEAGGLSLQALLVLTHGFQASVWRDRIFALLGLATPEARSYVTPDYSDEVPDRLILIRLTMCSIRTSLQPLHYASICRATSCPSWVPDWTAVDSNLERQVTKAMTDTSAPLLQYQAVEDYPHFEPPIENLLRYQEPLALLLRGFVVDRVQIAVQIPCLDGIASDDSMTQPLSIKTKVKEWELRLMECIESTWAGADGRPEWRQWEKQVIEQRLVEAKGLLIRYLCKSDVHDGRWIRSLQEFNLTTGNLCDSFELDDYRDLIDDYDVWMQCLPSSGYMLYKHNLERVEEDMCSHCVMGQKICRMNAGRTLFVTENAYHLSDPLPIQEGDVICLLLSSTSLFVMRKVDEANWTLVGILTPVAGPDEYQIEDLIRSFQENTTRGQAETFRLR